LKTARKILIGLPTAAFAMLIACQVAAQTTPAPETETDREIIENSKALRRQLMQIDMIAIPEPTPAETRNKDILAEMIDQVRALNLPQQPAANTDHIKPKPLPRQVNIEIQTSAQNQYTAGPAKDPITTATGKTSDAGLSTANRIATLLAVLEDNPQGIAEPMAIAEALFATGNAKHAAGFYQLTLDRMAGDTQDMARPWILFQLGNCFRKTDHTRAYKAYEQLIGEYPNSHWAEAAKAQQQTIAWLEKNSSLISLEQNDSDPNSL
jgi:tetratricopeptide (TPR) repeat protein